jgi:hypothetical protein
MIPQRRAYGIVFTPMVIIRHHAGVAAILS